MLSQALDERERVREDFVRAAVLAAVGSVAEDAAVEAVQGQVSARFERVLAEERAFYQRFV